VDFSRLKLTELVGLASSALLVLSLFMPWFTLGGDQHLREQQNAWVCGTGNFSCDAWGTFPIARWMLLAAAAAPVILIYLILRAQKGKYPAGEFTMTVGFACLTLIAFNGLLDKPGSAIQEFGISLNYGYFVALGASLLMAAAGAFRSLESGGGAQRKPPATF